MVAQVRSLLPLQEDLRIRIMLHGVATRRQMPRKTILRLKQRRQCPVDHKKSSDTLLGMGQSITRRDFLNATLLASGGLLLRPVSPAEMLADEGRARRREGDWTGSGGGGGYANCTGTHL